MYMTATLASPGLIDGIVPPVPRHDRHAFVAAPPVGHATVADDLAAVRGLIAPALKFALCLPGTRPDHVRQSRGRLRRRGRGQTDGESE